MNKEHAKWETHKIIILLSFGFFWLGCFNLKAQELRLATYNIRLDAKSDGEQGNGWQQRKGALTQLIRFHDFDIFGAQEVLKNQLDDMLGDLSDYSYVGVGRDDGEEKGEFSPIFYKKGLFSLLKSGTFWLSEDMERPNKGWDAALPRICTWGLFQDKVTHKEFMFFNTHFDHVGVQARIESAKLIMAKVKEIGKDKLPAILTGDFNVDQYSEGYSTLAGSGLLSDAYETAAFRYALSGTFSGFNINAASTSRIDHVFLTYQFKVKRYGILTDTYKVENLVGDQVPASSVEDEVSLARLPSDHYPVMVVVAF